jgi:integrase/recombinase XerD
VVPPDDCTIFLTNMGEPLSPNRLTQIAREYVAAAVNKTGACHIFRHTMATLMLEGGADIRFIQEMLGHVELSTTQIYTRVSIRKLKQVHEATHPSARLERRPRAPAADPASEEVGPAAVEELLGALDAEADEEDDGHAGHEDE